MSKFVKKPLEKIKHVVTKNNNKVRALEGFLSTTGNQIALANEIDGLINSDITGLLKKSKYRYLI